MPKTTSKPRKPSLSISKCLHFIGIGGSGMSALARVFLEKGYKVSGSDLKESPNTVRLKDLGAKIFYPQSATNLRSADIVVVSSAIDLDNPEYKEAITNNLPIYKRGELLGVLMEHYDKKWAVAGSHGKTTTSGLLAHILNQARLHPTYLIGGNSADLGGNAALGEGPYFVAESDESDGSFLYLGPTLGVFTNLEAEHLNHYDTFENLVDHFRAFMAGIVERGGSLVINKSDAVLCELAHTFPADRCLYYGLEVSADIQAKDIQLSPAGSEFSLVIKGASKGRVQTKLYGLHNVANILSAIAACYHEKLPLSKVISAIASYHGMARRFQLIGSVENVQIYDDYAHHPTEIKATIEAAKSLGGNRILCIFQPHRYSRTFSLLKEFGTAFHLADQVILTDIYSASEQENHEVSSEILVDEIKKNGKQSVILIKNKSSVASRIVPELRDGDVVFTMGAGDIHTISKEIVNQLKNRQKSLQEAPSFAA